MRIEKINVDVEIEKARDLYDFLTDGSLPEGYHINDELLPNMTRDEAFAIIWFLQEYLVVLPDTYEQCQKCKDLFHSSSEGYRGDHGRFCNYCIPDDLEY